MTTSLTDPDRYEATPEFKKKYDEPFERSVAFTQRTIGQLQVTDGEGENPRPATWDDFVELYNLPYAKAVTRAQEKFGAASQIVLNHMSELQRMQFDRGEALKAERAQQAANAKTADAQRLEQQTKISTAWTRLNKELSENVPEYRSTPEDKELDDLRQEGLLIIIDKNLLFGARNALYAARVIRFASHFCCPFHSRAREIRHWRGDCPSTAGAPESGGAMVAVCPISKRTRPAGVIALRVLPLDG